MQTREESGHDDRLLKQYLLGALASDETERLDELSVADNEFAERLEAVEYELVDAYVRGELTGEMLAQFRSFYLATPKRRERVQLAQGLRVAVEQRGRASDTIATRSVWRRVFTLPRPALQWGIAAAAVVLVTVASWLGIENRRLRDQRDAAVADRRSAEQRIQQLETQLAKGSPAPEQKLQPAPGSEGKPVADSPVILALNLAPQMRGVGQIPTIVIVASVDYIALQLELESAEYSAWRVRLRLASRREPIWRSGRLSAYAREDARIVPVSFPARLIEAQPYIAELAGISASGSEELVASYPFRVIRK